MTSFAVVGLLRDDDDRAAAPRNGAPRDDLATRGPTLAPPGPAAEPRPREREETATPSSATTIGGRPSGTVRLAGTLVAERLEAAWVHAWQGEGPYDGPEPEEEPEEAFGRYGLGWQRPSGATAVGLDGAFALDLPPGRHVVLAGALGCATRVEAIDVLADRDDVVWTLAWTAPATLEVVVVTATGDPFAGASLEVDLAASGFLPPIVAVGSGPWPRSLPIAAVLDATHVPVYTSLDLDAAGAGRLTLPPATYLVAVGSVHWPRPTSVIGRSEGATATPTVTLAPGAVERVTFTDGRPGSPLPCRVVVRVRDATGRPVDGALVGTSTFQPTYAAHQYVGRDDDERRAQTGPDGVATLINLHPGGLWLVARGEGHSGWTGPIVLETPGAHLSAEVVLEDLEPLGDLIVRVVARESGEPVDDAWVGGVPSDERRRATNLETVAPGVLRLREVPAGEFLGRVHAPGRASQVVTLTIEAGRVHAVMTALAPEGLVSGRVIAESPRPAGADLLCRRAGDLDLSRGLLATATVQQDGSFRLGGLPCDVEVTLGLRLRGWFTAELTVRPPALDVELRLPSDPQISEVLVLGSSGAPVRGALVSITQQGWHRVHERTDYRGLAILRGKPPTDAIVSVDGRARGPLVAGGRTVVQLLDDATAPVVVWSRSNAEVRGVVVDASNAPLPFALAGLLRDRSDARPSGADGAFSLTVPVGPARLWAWRADRAATVLDVVVPEGGLSGVVLRLPTGVRLRVRAPATISGIVGRRDEADVDADVKQWVRSSDSTFDLGLVAPGRWTIQGRGTNRQPTGSPVEVDVQGPGPVVVDLR